MVDFKKIISEKIGEITNVDSKNIYEFIETPPNKEMGDYAFPCFKLAKDLKKAPPVIANELKDKLTFENNEIVKIEIAGGIFKLLCKCSDAYFWSFNRGRKTKRELWLK